MVIPPVKLLSPRCRKPSLRWRRGAAPGIHAPNVPSGGHCREPSAPLLALPLRFKDGMSTCILAHRLRSILHWERPQRIRIHPRPRPSVTFQLTRPIGRGTMSRRGARHLARGGLRSQPSPWDSGAARPSAKSGPSVASEQLCGRPHNCFIAIHTPGSRFDSTAGWTYSTSSPRSHRRFVRGRAQNSKPLPPALLLLAPVDDHGTA
jgi:hypothetical protein